MSKQFWAVVLVIIVAFVGIFAISSKKADTTNGSNTSQPSNHVEGLDQDHVTLVEYGDYQCPYCGEYYPTLKQIETEYNSQISFQFRNFPLISIHQNAFAGSRAAEAASLQGKFWQMHDLLYEQNEEYYASNETYATWINSNNPESYFEQYASQLGLNVTKFESDYASNQVNNVINADLAVGNKLNIQGTPTFFLDGKQVTLANTTTAFEKVINAAIAANKTSTSTTSSN